MGDEQSDLGAFDAGARMRPLGSKRSPSEPSTIVYVEPLGGRRGPPRSLAILAESSSYRAHYLSVQGSFLDFARAHAGNDARLVELVGWRERWSKLRSFARCAKGLRGVEDRLVWVANGLTGIWIVAPLATLRTEPVILFFRDSAEPGWRARTAMQLWKTVGLKVFALAPSRYGLAALLQSMDLPSLGVVPNAVTSISGSSRQLPDKPRVGWIGNSRPIKGLDLVVQLAGQLSDASLEWALFGSGLDGNGEVFPYVLRCRQLAQEKNVEESLSWRGYVDSEDIMREIDLLVVMSERESCSRAILEALAQGVPVVAPDVGGNSEILAGPLSECLFDRSDISSAEAIVRKVIGDRAFYHSVSQLAIERARSFTASTVAELFDRTLVTLEAAPGRIRAGV